MATFSEVYAKSQERAISQVLNGVETTPEAFAKNLAVLDLLLSRNNETKKPKVDMREALTSSDASVLFPIAMSDVLIRPKEPLMIGQQVLAKTVQMDAVMFKFPHMGALRAFDIPEAGAYREDYLSFANNYTEVVPGKVGLLVGVTEEVVKDSMWDILALYLEAAGYAMARHKEEKIFNAFSTYGHTVFDNDTEVTANWTSGRSYSQARNFSVGFGDLIDAMGVLIAHEYVPTDIILHPLAWTVFAKDPVLKAIALQRGAVGQNVLTNLPSTDPQQNIPWAISSRVTPFVRYSPATVLTSSQASGLAACGVTDIHIIDRNNACVVMQRDQMSVEEFNNPLRDIMNIKVRERYGIGVLNEGKAISVLKNIRLEDNWAPVQSVLSVTPS